MQTAPAVLELASDARKGLCHAGQKTLPSKWFYDDLGSALFEAITVLPEYGLTRADLRLLERHAGEIAARLTADGAPVRVIELGSGSGKKTRLIIDALRGGGRPPDFHPIDVSGAALESCVRELESLALVHPVRAVYGDGIPQAVARRRDGERLLTLFLGSNLGNFDPPCARALLDQLRDSLEPGDALLLGVDLVKPEEELIAAYDDAAGVTAAFNRNLLARVNRELDGDFPIRDFAHEARFNRQHSRMEMHLKSMRDLSVTLGELETQVHFRKGETIWTESSYKFDPARLAAMADLSGFRVEASWIDREWPFAENLWVAV
jgi:dimethylhistidine N-methyltransferase